MEKPEIRRKYHKLPFGGDVTCRVTVICADLCLGNRSGRTMGLVKQHFLAWRNHTAWIRSPRHQDSCFDWGNIPPKHLKKTGYPNASTALVICQRVVVMEVMNGTFRKSFQKCLDQTLWVKNHQTSCKVPVTSWPFGKQSHHCGFIETTWDVVTCGRIVWISWSTWDSQGSLRCIGSTWCWVTVFPTLRFPKKDWPSHRTPGTDLEWQDAIRMDGWMGFMHGFHQKLEPWLIQKYHVHHIMTSDLTQQC